MISSQDIKVDGETAVTDHTVDLMVETNPVTATMNHTVVDTITTAMVVVTARAATVIQVCY